MNKVVPFGRYRGQTVDKMIGDEEWLMSQDWFVKKYPDINTLVLDFGHPEMAGTPMHNMMQAKFLDDSYSMSLALEIEPELRKDVVCGTSVKVISSYINKEFEVDGWDVRLDVIRERATTTPSCHLVRLYIELKPAISDDYPSVLRQVKRNRERVADDNCAMLPSLPIYRSKKIFAVVCNEFSSSAITMEQVSQIFSLSGFRFIVVGQTLGTS